MTKRIRLLYLTYHENIPGSGILYTQVIRMLETLRNVDPNIRIILLSFISPRLLLWSRRDFRRLRERLSEAGICMICLPMIVPMKWGWGWHVIIAFWMLPVLLISLTCRCTIIHARSYGAGLLAFLVSRTIRIPFVFDPRGPFPEEYCMNGHWRSQGRTFRIWKRIESLLIKNSDAVVGVTTEYRDDFLTRGARKSVFVPNRTDAERFTREIDRRKSDSGGILELLYTGELHSTWNDPDVIVKHFANMHGIYPRSRLRIVTNADYKSVLTSLEKYNVDRDLVMFQSATPHEMPRVVQGASLGLIMCVKGKTSIWPVKFAEYLAAGIPVLVDANLEGLLPRIVQKQHLGLVVDPEVEPDYWGITDIMNDWKIWSGRCADYANRRLDLSSTVRQYLKIYRHILKKKEIS